MTDTKLLDAAIERSGKDQQGVADALGISLRSLRARVENRTRFRLTEITLLCEILGIDSLSERNRIFLS